MSRAVVAIMMDLATFVATATVATAARRQAAPLGALLYEGYLFVYFTGEGRANGEQIYIAANRGDWDGAQRPGSRSIMVWESRDLMNWSAQRSVQVSPPTAGNTWAPEAQVG